MNKTVVTFDDVIEALGGLEPVRKMTNRRTVQVVCNWRQRGFPPDTFFVLSMELKKRRFKADPELFGQVVREDA